MNEAAVKEIGASRPQRSSKKANTGRSSRPILRKAIPRERLFQQLDRFQEGPIIWVSGASVRSPIFLWR